MNRQDSLTDQLRSLIPVANFHGMYDAADFLNTVVKGADARCRECHGAMQEVKDGGFIHAEPILKAGPHAVDKTGVPGVIHERPPMGGRRIDFNPRRATDAEIAADDRICLVCDNEFEDECSRGAFGPASPDPRSPFCHE